MADTPLIQWFPGHMKKTERLIEKNLYLVDLIVEIADARIPLSSRNPNLRNLIGNKPRLLLLNKTGLADPAMTKAWIQYFQTHKTPCLAIDCKSGAGIQAVIPKAREILKDVIAKRQEKGQSGRALRMMVVGIPNAGKSSFINRMAGNKRAKVEDRPGVTRGKQWVNLESGVELLDMPGVLWPKFEDPAVGEKLAFTGAVKDGILDIELLAMRFLEWLTVNHPDLLTNRYKLEHPEDYDDFQRLEAVGKKRGMLISGGEVDTERAAITVMDEYRGGKLGRLTFEAPPESQA